MNTCANCGVRLAYCGSSDKALYCSARECRRVRNRERMREYTSRPEVKARRKPDPRDACPCGQSKTATASQCAACQRKSASARGVESRLKSGTAHRRVRALVHVGVVPFTWLPPQHPAFRMSSQPSRLMFVMGPCLWCGEPFTTRSTTGLATYCSKRCMSRAGGVSRGSRFRIAPTMRLAIYERDAWMCQLCGDPVERDLAPADQWAPSLDHIVCRSKGGADDPENLRLAHRWCNSVRGDERYYTAADLVA